MGHRPYSPLLLRLPGLCRPEDLFERMQKLPYCCWLDSALDGDARSRYSFLCADPIDTISLARPVADPLVRVEHWIENYRSEPVAGIPPFQGGVAGYLAYEFGRCFEKVPAARHDEFELPIAVLSLYDVVLAWDHRLVQGWLISQGFTQGFSQCFTADETEVRMKRAVDRADFFATHLQIPPEQLPPVESNSFGSKLWKERVQASTCQAEANRAREFCSVQEPSSSLELFSAQATAHGLTAEQFETRLDSAWLGNFSSLGYRQVVDRARDYIYAGDIFQVNLSQRLLSPARCSSPELYRQLRQINSAPFAGYFDFGDGQIISASPERFIKVEDGQIETRPIKGTRRRTGDPAADKQIAEELRWAVKDRAENTMIVDLLRNDLSRICQPDSLQVDQFCEVEEYPFVLHLVSSIRGTVRPGATVSDLLSAVFPGGSITGAPKVRAMEIIAELEPTVRGPYCGSLGYCSSSGAMDWNILIRTVTASRGWWQIQVGGGIVAASDAVLEEEETWTKAAGMIAAIDEVAN